MFCSSRYHWQCSCFHWRFDDFRWLVCHTDPFSVVNRLPTVKTRSYLWNDTPLFQYFLFESHLRVNKFRRIRLFFILLMTIVVRFVLFCIWSACNTCTLLPSWLRTQEMSVQRDVTISYSVHSTKYTVFFYFMFAKSTYLNKICYEIGNFHWKYH